MLIIVPLFLLFGVHTLCREVFDCSSIGGFSFNNKCYRFLHGDLDSFEKENEYYVQWKHAKKLCKKHFHSLADLGLITSAEEQELIVEYMIEKNLPEAKYWLGFMPEGNDRPPKHQKNNVYKDKFELIGFDSTHYEYSNWARSSKRNRRGVNCVYLSSAVGGDEKYKWNYQNCFHRSLGYPLCSLDLSLGELLSTTEDHLDVYTPIEPSDLDTCSSNTCKEEEESQLIDEKRYIFQIGFNKCATRSLTRFFQRGFVKACHWGRGGYAFTMYKNFLKNKLLLDGINHCVFISDMEYFPAIHIYRKFFKVLDKQYPNARFILNVRNKENWLRSRIRHGGGTYVDITAAYHNMDYEELFSFWGDLHDIHVNDVIEHFEGRPDKLLVFDIEKDNGSKLVEFFSDWFMNLKEEHWTKN